MIRTRRPRARGLSTLALATVAALTATAYVVLPFVADMARAASQEYLIPSDSWYATLLLALTFSATGFVIHRREPHLVGWIMHVVALLWAGAQLGSVLYILDGLGWDIGVAGMLVAAWAVFSWAPGLIVMAVFLPLVFPSGRPPSQRWWWVAGIGAAGLVFGFVAVTVDALTGPLDQIMTDSKSAILTALIVAGAMGAMASVVVRYRRAGDVERRQLKWVTAAFIMVCLVIAFAVTPPVQAVGSTVAAQLAVLVVMCTIPASVGIAITRHRLYEIDRILSRTVSYALLSLVLGAVYTGLLVVLGATLGPRSDLTVAASTLAAAAVFRPIQRRIQHAADRRFNRPRYHAQQELAAFAQRLRGQAELTTVSDDLIRAVNRTLQPSSAAVWIRNAQ